MQTVIEFMRQVPFYSATSWPDSIEMVGFFAMLGVVFWSMFRYS